MNDIPKLFTALAEWSVCLVFVLNLRRKRSPVSTAAIMAAFLVLLGALHIAIGLMTGILWLLGMFLAMALMYLCILLCCHIRPMDAVLCWSMAFLTAEFIAAVEWQIFAMISGGLSDSSVQPTDALPIGTTWFSNLFMLVFYLAAFLLFWALERPLHSNIDDYHLEKANLLSCLVVLAAVFFMSNISYVFPDTPLSASSAAQMFYIRTLVDFVGVLLLFTQQISLRDNALRSELANTNLLMQKQFEQYQFSRSNMERLNRRYHDMKHQIEAIRMESDTEKREGYLEDLESGIELYDSVYKTGNTVLDTVLTGKSMQCVQSGIQFSCVADGTLLNFMDTMDLCSLFGNALDNAIESSQKVEDRAKRIIRIAVYAQNGFVVARFENYYEQEFETEEVGGLQLPRTTKADKEVHGYGVKSIRMAAEKYGGTVTITAEDNWFYLRILIPTTENRG